MAVAASHGNLVFEWLAALSSLLLLGAFLLRSARLLKSPVHKGIRTEYAVALRSAVIFMAMGMVPLLLPCYNESKTDASHSWSSCPQSPYTWIPTNLMRIYHWLPFWYAFLTCAHLGAWLEATWEALTGTIIGMLAASLMNCLMPGGAGGLHYMQPFVERGWLPGGYSMLVATGFAILLAYCLFLSQLSTGMKQYALGAFTGLLVPFMNPATSTGYRAVLWDWDFNWNWNGAAMCGLWLVVVSAVLSAAGLGLVPCNRRSVAKHTGLAASAAALTDLALDTEGCLEWLLTNLQQNTWSFHAESSFFYIRQLGTRRTKAEALLAQARWECWQGSSVKQMEKIQKLAELLRQLRQVLRIELEHVRTLGHTCAGGLSDLDVDEFLEACGDGLLAFARDCKQRGGLSEKTRCKMCDAATQADRVLVRALKELSEDTGGRFVAQQAAFVDRLRSWPSLLDRAARGEDLQLSPGAAEAGPSWNKRHWFALRNTTSWTLALLWSVHIRGFSSSCVMSTSFIFSATTGSSFDTNLNRMIGVTMGLAVGNVPAILVLSATESGSAISMSFPQRTIIYLVVMLIMWAIAMYGYLAPGSKYKLACLLWAGNGGVQMLSHIPHFDTLAPGLFMDVLDNYLACVVVFMVDMLFAYFQRDSTSEQVKAATTQCTADVSVIVETLKAGRVASVDPECLQRHIKAARFWDGEIRKEGLIWTTLWEQPYKSDSVPALLDHFDEVYIAVYALQASAQRCSSEETAAKIITEVLQEGDVERCQVFVRAVRLVLQGWDKSVHELQALLESSGNGSLESEKSSPERKWMRSASKAICSKLQGESLESPPYMARSESCKSSLFEEGVTAANSQTNDSIAEAAAVEAVRLSTVALQIALHRIGGLLAAGSALASKDWRSAAHQTGSPLPSPAVAQKTPPKLSSVDDE
eukprot:TRINITY_DN35958_c0_g1_i1.p1 TRINITY_DN35958_c0_g1~~TRINITY_DN35958_c0_g1_i1.p1  ORF type:complete len:924 (-),score=176.27 TRINITY_DN35958_c0_g1_i1:218-2989(-)